MSDFVLRGYCKKCRQNVLARKNAVHESKIGLLPCIEEFPTQVVWLLSAKQMKVILISKEFREWLFEQDEEDRIGDVDSLYIYFEHNPFLVASILKKAGEQK